MVKSVELEPGRKVAQSNMPYMIAEIGANHNGNLELAKKLIDSAKFAGADAVKFQSWTPSSLISNYEYAKNTEYGDKKKHFGSLKEMVDAYYLDESDHKELYNYCRDSKITFISTGFSIPEVDLLNNLGVPYFKIASMDINNEKLLHHVASIGKPIILSTGMSSIGEIERAIETIESHANYQIILLHCVALYPPKYEDINLRNINMLRQVFEYPVGFSDHTPGPIIPLAAITLGACVVEKHFTLDRNMAGWDHDISADVNDFKYIVDNAKIIHSSLGRMRRVVSPDELTKRIQFRRSIVLTKPLNKGDIITSEDIDYKRPGNFISPSESKYVVGRRVKNNLDYDDVLRWEDLE